MATLYYKVFSVPTCFPEPISLGGTITTEGVIVTTYDGTTGQPMVGDYVYHAVLNEVRKVVKYAGENPILDSAFTDDLTSKVDLQVTDRVNYKSISISCRSVDGYLQGSKLEAFDTVTYLNEDGVSPFVINADGTEIAISGI